MKRTPGLGIFSWLHGPRSDLVLFRHQLPASPNYQSSIQQIYCGGMCTTFYPNFQLNHIILFHELSFGLSFQHIPASFSLLQTPHSAPREGHECSIAGLCAMPETDYEFMSALSWLMNYPQLNRMMLHM